MPTLTIFAGINGAGKSTLYRFQKTTKIGELGVRICPDEILEENGGDWTNFSDILNSGKIAIRRIDECIKTKTSFNWETTLISRTFYNTVERAKKQGFTINVNFIGVKDYDLAMKRIAHRIKKGGHGVPADIVKYRYDAQFNNIADILDLVDNAVFYDNTRVLQVIGTYHNHKLRFYNKSIKWTKLIEQQYKEKKDKAVDHFDLKEKIAQDGRMTQLDKDTQK